MVFESVVANILNRLLGDYFESLDTSQLNLGIWGGDVVLNDLVLKNSVFDDLGIPFKIVVGKLGSLYMKIPWKNLYNAPVELKLKDFLILIAPSSSVKYDALAEDKWKDSAKKKEIQRIDELKVKEEAKKRGDADAKPDDTFTEKLITQMIKNVQLSIENVHIRYEDGMTKPGSPFAFGITLGSLEVQTTDASWNPSILSDAVFTFNKLAKLEGLSVYWNSHTELIQNWDMNVADKLSLLREFIVPEKGNLTHVLGPINTTAHVTLTPNPDKGPEPFSLPKFWVDVEMEQLALGMNNLQFLDILELADNIDFMLRGQVYRKYRPVIREHRGHYREWWRFAYECIVGEEVRRRRENWDWDHIKRHRDLCKTYSKVYHQKLTETRISPQVSNTVSHCEKVLDIFNILLIRKQVEMRVEKEGKGKQAEVKKNEGGGGWFSGWGTWLSGGTTEQSASNASTDDTVAKVDEEMTAEEKSKLYSAIGYAENAQPVDYPEAYEDCSFNFNLKKLIVTLNECVGGSSDGKNVLNFQIDNVLAQLKSRPAHFGITATLSFDGLRGLGFQDKEGNCPPAIFTSKVPEIGDNLFNVIYDFRPLNSKADHRVKVNGNAIEIVYDIKTVSKLIGCFTVPQSTKLIKLRNAAAAKYNEMKERSASSIQYMLDRKEEIEVDIHLRAPNFLIAHNGVLERNTTVLVADLGEISLKSKPREKNWKKDETADTGTLVSNDELYVQKMLKLAYDSFTIELTNFKILLSLPNEGHGAIVATSPSLRDRNLPKPIIYAEPFVLTLSHSLLPNDQKLPLFHIDAKLPSVTADISERRLMELLKLLVTLPLPKAEDPSTELHPVQEDHVITESYELAVRALEESSSENAAVTEGILMLMKFKIDAVKLRINKERDNVELPMIDLEMVHLLLGLTSKSSWVDTDVEIGGLSALVLQNSSPVHLLKTPMTTGSDKYLLKIHFTELLKMPENGIPQDMARQHIKAEISSLDVILHQESFGLVLSLLQKLSKCMDVSTNLNRDAQNAKPRAIVASTSSETKSSNTSSSSVAKPKIRQENNVLEIDAKMESLSVQLSSERKDLLKAVLSTVDFSMIQRKGEKSITLGLTNLHVQNMNPRSLYKDIVTVSDGRVVHIKIAMPDEGTGGVNAFNMDKHDIAVRLETGSPKIVYINSFVEEAVNFIMNLGVSKKTISNASAAVAALVKDNVEQVVSASSRILLDIDVNAPLVIIPRNEHSPHALLADLGHLNLRNQFLKKQVGEPQKFAIIDQMEINLTETKVSRIYFDQTKQNATSEILILNPLNCKLSVERNQSPEYLNAIPAYDVKGSVRDATVTMSNEDYNLILGCLLENVAASSADKIEPKVNKAIKSSVKSKVIETGPKSMAASASNTAFVEMKASFNIPQVRFEMHQDESLKLEEQLGVVQRDLSTAFASVAIQKVAVNFEMFSDKSRSCPLVIEGIVFNDIRPGRRAITNLIQRRLDETNLLIVDTDPILRINYDNSPNAGTKLKVETKSLSIIFELDYILSIARFFRSSGAQSDLQNLSQDAGQIPSAAALEPVKDESFKASYELSSTEIILVETLDSLDTRALLLNFEGAFRQTSSGGKSNVMGNVKNLKLSSCVYNPHVRENTSAEIICPMSVGVVYNATDMTSAMIDVNISNIFVRLTAGTLELLTKIFGSIGTASSSNGGDIGSTDYSNVWHPKEICDKHFWFLSPDESGQDSLLLGESTSWVPNTELQTRNEVLMLESGSIVFTFETGNGNTTVPLIMIETDVNLQMSNWSSLMKMEGRMKLEAASYNTTFGMWEYIIEPVNKRNDGNVALQPWEIWLDYSTTATKQSQYGPSEKTKSVVVRSNDVLELTVTKTALNAINMLTEDFSSAVKELVSQREISTAPYTIVNDTGMDVIIYLNENGNRGPFRLIRNGDGYDMFILERGKSIDLDLHDDKDLARTNSSILLEQQGRADRLLSIEIPEIEFKTALPVTRSAKRFFPLSGQVTHGHYGLVCDVGVKDCTKVVTLRGVVQIVNELDVSVDVYCMTDGKTAKLVGSAAACKRLNLPLECTNTDFCSIFFAPEGHSASREAFYWDALMHSGQVVKELKYGTDKAPFNITVVGKTKQVFNESTNQQNVSSQCCTISLKAPLLLENLLPVPIVYYIGGTDKEIKFAEGGSIIQLTDVRAGREATSQLFLQIPNYQYKSWKCETSLNRLPREISAVAFTAEDGSEDVLTLGIHRETRKEQTVMHLYSPFWMINRTGLNLIYKGEGGTSVNAFHSKNQDIPAMFSFSGGSFFEKKKFGHVKINDKSTDKSDITTDWSERFSLDAAGSAGSVTCKSPRQNFQIGVEIKMSSWGLTRYVTFTPRFYISNQCPYPIGVIESDAPTNEVEIASGKCVPFWPKCQRPHIKAVVVTSNRRCETQTFKYDVAENTVLQMNNQVGGLHVDVCLTESKTTITFSKFIPNQSPALLINKCGNLAIEFTESDSQESFLLCPGQQQYFTWRNMLGPRVLTWWPTGMFDTRPSPQLNTLLEDDYGDFEILEPKTSEKKRCYWISFLNGSQRCLMYTEDPEAIRLLRTRDTGDPIADYSVHLQGLGLSLVDNEKMKEVMYTRISSSGVVWEQCTDEQRKRFKVLSQVTHSMIEAAYQDYLNRKSISKSARSTIQFDSGLLVDFKMMRALKPGSFPIRRVFEPGVWLSYKILPQTTQIHAKLNTMQIDNQLQDAVFQVVLAPVKPPKTVAEQDTTVKPFAEISVTKRTSSHSNVIQYKYAKILVQEFLINVDLQFVNALVELLVSSSKNTEDWQEKYVKEYKKACMPLDDFLARQIQAQGQQHFYDYLHFPPLKIHLSFSMIGSTKISNPLLKLVIAGLGVTLTEMQDVILKLPCFEVRNKFLSFEQLQSDVSSHYISHGLRQMYVLVLGLDVIGNPYGLAMGVAKGIEAFFYEPVEGAMHGEFAQGVALGVKSLVGGTVGGTAGTFSKIAGSLGRGVAALTFDDDYQKKRREALRNRGGAAESFEKSGKGLLMGFVDGVAGVVAKPIEGGKKEGFAGFLKGAVKGAAGLVAKPATGVVDFAGGSLDAVKKATSTEQTVKRIRPPRNIPTDTILQPYIYR